MRGERIEGRADNLSQVIYTKSTASAPEHTARDLSEAVDGRSNTRQSPKCSQILHRGAVPEESMILKRESTGSEYVSATRDLPRVVDTVAEAGMSFQRSYVLHCAASIGVINPISAIEIK